MRRQRRLLLYLFGFPLFPATIYLVFNLHTFQTSQQFSHYFSSPVEQATIENSLHQIGTNRNLAIFSVFLDRRVSDNQTEIRSLHGHLNGVLRIILVKKRGFHPKISCLFNNKASVPSRNLHGKIFAFYELTENHQRPYGGYSIHCDVPQFADLTKGVSIGICGQNFSVLMPVIHANASMIETLPSKQSNAIRYQHRFSVCVPALHNTTNLNRIFLADWLKVHVKLGVTNFRIYYSEVIPRSVKVIFESIRDKANVEFYPVHWKENNRAVLRDSWYYLQTVTVNDCLLRSLYDTEYAFFGDLDEALVPHSENISNWSELVGQIWTDRNIPGICFPTFLFKESSSGMADSLIRLNKTDAIRSKCLVRPSAIFEMGIHHISKPFEESKNSRLNNSMKLIEYAFIHHYHRSFPSDRDKEAAQDVDKSILRFLAS